MVFEMKYSWLEKKRPIHIAGQWANARDQASKAALFGNDLLDVDNNNVTGFHTFDVNGTGLGISSAGVLSISGTYSGVGNAPSLYM